MSARILVVEDDPFAQNMLLAVFNGAGYEADVAPDGFAALRLLRENVYRIALIDYHLPAMDGYALAKLMRDPAWTGASQLKLVAVTADRHGLAARADVDTLFDAILFKPFKPRELIGLLENADGGSEAHYGSSHICDAAAAFIADPSIHRARAAAMSFWRARGLRGLPKAHVLPAPTADQATEISLCFDIVGWEAAELILLIDENGFESFSKLRRQHNSTPPVASLNETLRASADVFFRVSDPNSWTEVARCLQWARAPVENERIRLMM